MSSETSGIQCVWLGWEESNGPWVDAYIAEGWVCAYSGRMDVYVVEGWVCT